MTAPYRDNKKLVERIARALKLDKRVTAAICRSSLEFTANVFRNKEDFRPIRHRYLGILAIIEGKEKN